MTVPDWVNVIALTPDHQLVLVRQFRFGIDDFLAGDSRRGYGRGEEPLPRRSASCARRPGNYR